MQINPCECPTCTAHRREATIAAYEHRHARDLAIQQRQAKALCLIHGMCAPGGMVSNASIQKIAETAMEALGGDES